MSFIVNENHSREWCDEDNGMWNYTCHWFWVMWVWASLVNQFTFMQSLRIISVVDLLYINRNTLSPNWMEVNSGKSSQSNHITINHSQTQHDNTERMHFHQRWVIWAKACLVITHSEWEYSSTPVKHNRMRHYPFEWKSIQASLVNHSYHNQSLLNTTREHSLNAPAPNTSDLREGMSSHHSLWMRILFNSNEA